MTMVGLPLILFEVDEENIFTPGLIWTDQAGLLYTVEEPDA